MWHVKHVNLYYFNWNLLDDVIDLSKLQQKTHKKHLRKVKMFTTYNKILSNWLEDEFVLAIHQEMAKKNLVENQNWKIKYQV